MTNKISFPHVFRVWESHANPTHRSASFWSPDRRWVDDATAEGPVFLAPPSS